jgi:hypothetical protein
MQRFETSERAAWRPVELELDAVMLPFIMMRTTLNLPDDVTNVIRAVAETRGMSLGDAAAELIRRGLRSDCRLAEELGIPCFSIPADALPITLEQTLAAEDR